MFAGELISQNIPFLHMDDMAGKALQEMNDFHISHLPVVEEEVYIGLIGEDDLLDSNENQSLKSLKELFIKPYVLQNDSFLLAVKRAIDFHVTVIPVIDEQLRLIGAISEDNLFKHLAVFVGTEEQGGLIILEMEKNEFSISELCRLIESNDASITQLNSYLDPGTQILTITIRINKTEVSDVIATLQRHDYRIKFYYGEELYQNELHANFYHLMNYLNI